MALRPLAAAAALALLARPARARIHQLTITNDPRFVFSVEAFGRLMYKPIAARAKHGQAPPAQAS